MWDVIERPFWNTSSIDLLGSGKDRIDGLGYALFQLWWSFFPVPDLLISLEIYDELGQEGLYTTVVIYGQKARLEFLSEVQILVSVYLYWWLRAYSNV